MPRPRGPASDLRGQRRAPREDLLTARFARPYAEAFLQTAPAGYDFEKFLSGAAAIRDALAARRDLRAVLASPGVAQAAKEAILDALGARASIDETGRRFLQVILKNRRMGALPDILGAVRKALDERAGVVPARVTAATALSEAERNRLVEELSRRTGKRIRATFEVDPSLLAGFVARVESRIYDASVSTAIEKFKEEAYGN